MQNFLRMINGGVIATAGDGKIGMVDARDVGAAAAAVLSEEGHEGKTYVLTGPEALTHEEAAGILAETVGIEIRHVPVAPDEIRDTLRQMTGDIWWGHLIVGLHTAIAAGELAPVTDAVERLTGRAPRTLAEFARDHAAELAGTAPAVA
jgi:uncharacterized protein YbjT (DUF2867 family)